MARRPLQSVPHLVEAQGPTEPSGPIDMAAFTRRLHAQALRVLEEIEVDHEAMAIDDECKLLNTLGVLGKNLIAMIKGSADDSHAGSTVRKYARAFAKPVRKAPGPAASEDDGIDLGNEESA